ncbi:hypothetical protein [Pseudalkalibacillus caeni]|uniref:Lipoprotein n=1 Tax=Exobacillus caeni TaxID=2574798 RepID=A0A5R9F0L1_9BACL|nr:hypothetical protein [Pseudalkalibacillus caeni]TLS36229.1 hypothetical protein FCL54_16475 [Pseudalkalibacillus caeni]
MTHRKVVILTILMCLSLVACSKEPLINENYNNVSVINTSTDKVLYETTNQEKVNEIISEINNSKRTDTWEGPGSVYSLVLSDDRSSKEASYHLQEDGTGEIVIDGYYVYTRFYLIE